MWVGVVGAAVLTLAGCGQAASSAPSSSPATAEPGPNVSLAPVPAGTRRPATTVATAKPAVILHGATTTTAPVIQPNGDPVPQLVEAPASTDTSQTAAPDTTPSSTVPTRPAPSTPGPTTGSTGSTGSAGTTPSTAVSAASQTTGPTSPAGSSSTAP